MKTIKVLSILTLLLLSNAASAGWNPTTIRNVQMDIGSSAVYVYFDTKIQLDTYPDPTVSTVGGAILRTSQPLFEEMYARILVAEKNDETIQILSTAGVCGGSTFFWADNPYIRFGS